MLGAIYTGIFDTHNTFDLSHVCLTGNCTWTPYPSLGICSKCVDVTSALSKSCSTYEYPASYGANGSVTSYTSMSYCNYTMPDGGPSTSGLGYSGYQALNLSSGGNDPAMNISAGNSFQGMANPISVLNAITGSWASDAQQQDQVSAIRAAQCALFYCVNRYQANVTKGVLHETLLSSWYNKSATFLQADGPTDNVYLEPPSSFLNGSGPDSEFIVAPQNAQALSSQLFNMWVGNISFAENGAGSYTSSNDIANLMYGQDLSSLPTMMGNLAKSMTKNMRNADTSHPALGTVRQDVPFVLV